MIFPNFLIIGCPRGGTTSLYRYLRRHPEIFMPDKKELRYFAFKDKKLDYLGYCGDVFNKNSISRFKDYELYFEDIHKEKAIGEASPIYLWNKDAPKNIYEHNPEMKLIAILRNPIDRAYSGFKKMRDMDYERIFEFKEALKIESRRKELNLSPFFRYKEKGFYFEQLSRYLELFKREQIKIFLFEDFKFNLEEVLADIFNFLEVDASFIPPNIDKIFNSSKNIYRDIPEESKDFLINAYKEDIKNLEILLDKDLSLWLK